MRSIEHQCAVAFMVWWGYQYKRFGVDFRLLYPNLNGGFRHIATARKLKAEGSRPGIPDYFLAVPRNGSHGLYIELKAGGVGIEKGRPSKDQLEFGALVQAQGYQFVVAYGTEEACKAVENYLGGKSCGPQ